MQLLRNEVGFLHYNMCAGRPAGSPQAADFSAPLIKYEKKSLAGRDFHFYVKMFSPYTTFRTVKRDDNRMPNSNYTKPIYEALFASFMTHTSDGIVIVDLQGKVLDVNQAFERLHGWTREEMIGKTLPIVPSYKVTEGKELYRLVLDGKSVNGYESYRLKKDGSLLYVSTSITPIWDEEGRIIAIIGVEREIRSHKTTEVSLRETEMLYECLVENAMTGVYMYQDDRMVYANPYFTRLFGYDHDEALRFGLDSLIVPDDWAILRDIALQTLEGRLSAFPFSIRGMKKDGSLVYLEGLLTSTTYKGKPSLLGTFHDVTYKNETEETLRESAQRYQRLIKFLPEPIVVSDEGIVIYANKSALKLFRTASENDLIGKSLFHFIQPEHHKPVKSILQKVLKTDDPSHFLEMGVVCCDGQSIEAEMSSIRIHHYTGKTVTVSVIRDITDRKQAEELMVRSEKLSIVGQLAAGLAHEIRNPLTSLKGFTQLLKSRSKDDTFYFDTMLTELERINLIVNDFMTLAKPQLSHFGYGNVNSMLDHVISILNHQAILMNVSLISKASKTLPDIYCDENQLKQVFINLIKNAIEAMPRGGNVVITAEQTNPEHICIRIKDQGEGIPDQIVGKLGEPFLTTKENGTGLGLMISYRIIEHHRGSMTIKSGESKGTTIELLLPINGERSKRPTAAYIG